MNFQKNNIWNFGKKNISTRNPKHIRPAYTVQLYTRPGLINRLNFQKKNIALSKSKHMARLYNAVVYAAYKQIIKFPHIQCDCISGLQTDHQIPAYTVWLYKRVFHIPAYTLWLYKRVFHIPAYTLWLYKRVFHIPMYTLWLYMRLTSTLPNSRIYNTVVYAA